MTPKGLRSSCYAQGSDKLGEADYQMTKLNRASGNASLLDMTLTVFRFQRRPFADSIV
jgi:hypothetical protein